MMVHMQQCEPVPIHLDDNQELDVSRVTQRN
jgi:hypothetical protein